MATVWCMRSRANWPSRFVNSGETCVKQDASLVGRAGQFAAKVEIGLTRLLRSGVNDAWQDAVTVLEELGIAMSPVACRGSTCARTDTRAGCRVSLVHYLAERRYVTRFKKGYTLIPSDPTETETCYLGRRGYLTLRIYDRARSIASSCQKSKAM